MILRSTINDKERREVFSSIIHEGIPTKVSPFCIHRDNASVYWPRTLSGDIISHNGWMIAVDNRYYFTPGQQERFPEANRVRQHLAEVSNPEEATFIFQASKDGRYFSHLYNKDCPEDLLPEFQRVVTKWVTEMQKLVIDEPMY